MKIAKWFAGTPTPSSRDGAAASSAKARAPGGWSQGLSKRLASLRAAFTGGRPAASRPALGSATLAPRPGRPTRPLPAIPTRHGATPAGVAPLARPRQSALSAEAASAGLAATIVHALRQPSPEQLIDRWTPRIGAAARRRPYLDSLAESALGPRAAMAVTELAVAMAQAKLRDDIVRGFVPNPHDHLVETRYLSYARSVVMPDLREQIGTLGEAAACEALRKRAQALRDAANATRSA